jgi:hypothetical protein
LLLILIPPFASNPDTDLRGAELNRTAQIQIKRAADIDALKRANRQEDAKRAAAIGREKRVAEMFPTRALSTVQSILEVSKKGVGDFTVPTDNLSAAPGALVTR